jgi:hypothetical protein
LLARPAVPSTLIAAVPTPRCAPEPSNPPAGLQIEPSDWRVFTATHLNTLINGESLAVTRVLNAAWLTLDRPVFWCDGPRLTLPTDRAGTFVIWRADRLDPEDQQQLLRWLQRRETPRVLARSPRALFALVEEGQFAAELYYRLNTLTIQVEG